MEHNFGWDAPSVQACPSELLSFNQGNLDAFLGKHEGGRISSGSSTNNHHLLYHLRTSKQSDEQVGIFETVFKILQKLGTYCSINNPVINCQSDFNYRPDDYLTIFCYRPVKDLSNRKNGRLGWVDDGGKESDVVDP